MCGPPCLDPGAGEEQKAGSHHSHCTPNLCHTVNIISISHSHCGVMEGEYKVGLYFFLITETAEHGTKVKAFKTEEKGNEPSVLSMNYSVNTLTSS